MSPDEATSRITGLNPEEPLYDQVRDIIGGRQQSLTWAGRVAHVASGSLD
jgi:hypothetical protein